MSFYICIREVSAMEKNRQCYSGIGGQAVIEGVMMRCGEKYAIAMRAQDGRIEIKEDVYKGVLAGSPLRKVPFVRGFFALIDSLVLGMHCTNVSAELYGEEEEAGGPAEAPSGKDPGASPAKKEEESGWEMILVMGFSILLAVGLFILLPLGLTSLLGRVVKSPAVLAIAEGLLRLAIFLAYVTGISALKDIRRLYQYHGAEHKCINCIESGLPLTVENAAGSTRLHKRCGSSFLLFVMMISMILFFFIRVGNPLLKVVVRLLMIPVVSGISFEIIRLAGASDNPFIRIISAPGLWLQRLTTREPDEEMLKVGIASVEAVFDWRAYQEKTFGAQTS